MKFRLSFSLLLAGVILCAVPARADFIAQAVINGAQEPTASPGTGLAILTYNSALQDLMYSINFQGLESDATVSHIHFGALGVNGPVILPFNPGPPADTHGAFAGTLTAANFIPDPAGGLNTFADAIAAIEAGDTYVNIHSAAFPAGEIRGQVSLTPEPTTLGLFSVVVLLGYLGRRRLKDRQQISGN